MRPYIFFFFKVLSLLDAVFYAVLPFLLTLLFSSFTLFVLVRDLHSRNSKKSQTLPLPQVCHFNSTLNTIQIPNAQNSPQHHQKDSNQPLPDHEIKLRSAKKTTSRAKMTLMLMAFPCSYLITTAPVFFIIICQVVTTQLGVTFSTSFEAEFAFAKTSMFVNNSFNILLLILLGKNLRKDMLSLLACWCCRSHSQAKASETLVEAAVATTTQPCAITRTKNSANTTGITLEVVKKPSSIRTSSERITSIVANLVS